MVQMTPADQRIVKAIPGNDKCAECGMKNPQWASVSFGTVFCLECSGVHRSLGVHISFVRSIAMDSWTDGQLALMKTGGNKKCADYLTSKGINANTPIKAKYESDPAQLYKEVLKARVAGKPEPTVLAKPVKKAPYSGGSMGSASSHSSGPGGFGGGGGGGAAASSAGGGSQDPNGMERLAGESDSQYVARQTRLRDEAKARMAAKFGGGGGMGGGGGGRGGGMGGVGSDPNYNPNGGYGGGGGVDVNAVTDSLVSGFGMAFSTLGSAARSASTTASGLVSDPSTKRAIADLGATGSSLWGSLASGVSNVAASITQPDDGDALADLQNRFSSQSGGTGGSKYGGFGSDSVQTGGGGGMSNHSTAASSTASSSYSNNNNAVGTMAGEDPNGIERLSGETDDMYVARQTRLRDEAKARMAAKFGGGKASMSSASSGPAAGAGGSAPSSGNMGAFGGGGAAPKPTPTKMKVDNSEDFFANFGT